MKRILYVFVLLFCLLAMSQDYSGDWRSYLSYNKITDISASDDLLYVATENAFFTVDKSDYSMKGYSTIDGLSGGEVSSTYFSNPNEAFVLGYRSGLLQIFDAVTHEITSVVDIENKLTIAADRKIVNHILEYNGYLYLSCGFGISVYDLQNLEFDDTYYLGPNGGQLRVNQSVIFQGYLYAATEGGIYRAMVSNDNIIDFDQWELVTPGNWIGIIVNNGVLSAVSNNVMYEYVNQTFVYRQSVGAIKDFRSNEEKILVTREGRFLLFNEDFTGEFNVIREAFSDFGAFWFTCGYLENGILYLGTDRQGLIAFDYQDLSTAVNLTPQGTYLNNVVGMNIIRRNLWMVFGDYGADYDPWTNGVNSRGVSIYRQQTGEWLQLPVDSLLGARELNSIVYNPNRVNDVYIGSFYDGILKITNLGEEIELYDENNSGLEDLFIPEDPGYSGDTRVSGMAFDEDDNLWVLNSKIDEPIKVLRADGSWGSYSVTEVISDPLNQDRAFKELVIGRNGYKFIATANHGLLGFYENGNDPQLRLLREGEGNGNLPSDDVRAVVLDRNNQLWIGTNRGLRVLYNTTRFFESTRLESNEIIILEDGEASELMYQQWINDIFVDGANNKWISTADAGAFYVSSDGQETIYHFTTENSPLPSNSVNEIVVDEQSGEVFFATSQGVVSFKGSATGGSEDLSDIYAYPNPVRPEFAGNVTIRNLSDNARVKITDVTGNLVYDQTTQGGSMQWNLSVFDKYKVASGVYFVLVSGEDGLDTQVCKIMVVR